MNTKTITKTTDLTTIPYNTFVWNKELRKGFILYRPINESLILDDYSFENVITHIEQLTEDELKTLKVDSVEFNYGITDLGSKRSKGVNDKLNGKPDVEKTPSLVESFFNYEKSVSRYFIRSFGGRNRNFTTIDGRTNPIDVIEPINFIDITIDTDYGSLVLIDNEWTYTISPNTTILNPNESYTDTIIIISDGGVEQSINIVIIGTPISNIIHDGYVIENSDNEEKIIPKDKIIYKEPENVVKYGFEPNTDDTFDPTNIYGRTSMLPTTTIEPIDIIEDEEDIENAIDTPFVTAQIFGAVVAVKASQENRDDVNLVAMRMNQVVETTILNDNVNLVAKIIRGVTSILVDENINLVAKRMNQMVETTVMTDDVNLVAMKIRGVTSILVEDDVNLVAKMMSIPEIV